jgi:hypothetical protein
VFTLHSRAIRRAATTAAATTLFVTTLALTVPAGAESTSRSVDETADDPAGTFQCDPDLPLTHEDACDPAWNLPDPDKTLEQVRDATGERFAGSWIDRADEANPRLVYRVVDLNKDDRALLSRLDGAKQGQIQVLDATYSKNQLDAVASTIVDTLIAEGHQLSIAVDQVANVVNVGVVSGKVATAKKAVLNVLERSDKKQVQDALTRADSAKPDNAPLIQFGTDEIVEPAVSRTTYPNHNGGLSLVLTHIGNGTRVGCTSGYTIESVNGAMMGLTAGHCASSYLGDNISIGGTHLSRSGQNSYLGASPRPSDSMRYSLAAASHADDNVFVNGTSRKWRDVNGPSFPDEPHYRHPRLLPGRDERQQQLRIRRSGRRDQEPLRNDLPPGEGGQEHVVHASPRYQR